MKNALRLILGPREPDRNDPTPPALQKNNHGEDETVVPLNLDVFFQNDILTEAQCVSIKQDASKWSTAGSAEAAQDVLLKWANTILDSIDATTTAPDVFEFEEAELDVGEPYICSQP